MAHRKVYARGPEGRVGRDVPGVAVGVKLHFKARAGETGVGAEPLPQERGQPVGKRVANVGSARAGPALPPP